MLVKTHLPTKKHLYKSYVFYRTHKFIEDVTTHVKYDTYLRFLGFRDKQ